MVSIIQGGGGGFSPEQAELWGGWRRDGSGQDFWGFKLSARQRIAIICVLDGWRLDLLSEAYTSSWWPGERNLVVLKKVKVLSQLITLTFLLFVSYIVSA